MKFNITLKEELFNEIYLPYLNFYNTFYLILYGGGSSGKSFFLAQRNIFNLLKGGRNYLICRKVGSTVKDSIFAEYKKVIFLWKLEKYFKINSSDFTIQCKLNLFKMLFKGLDDPEKKKSITFDRGVLTDIHYEEATEENNPEVLYQLETRLRGNFKYKGQKIKKQIVLSFNPILESHWIKKEYFDNKDQDVTILKTTYKDNKFLSEEDIHRIKKWKKTRPAWYDVYGLGNWGTLGHLIFHNWKVEDLNDIKDKLSNYNVGLDFGFSVDPSVILLTAFHNNKVYVLKEYYQKGLLNNQIAKILKTEFNGYYIWADSAEPKSIKELQLYGCPVMGVKKGKDSIIHGLNWLKQYEMIIDRSCKHTIAELQGYCYMTNKQGEILNKPVDMNNHCMDSLRYSIERLMILSKANTNLKASDLGI